MSEKLKKVLTEPIRYENFACSKFPLSGKSVLTEPIRYENPLKDVMQ